MTGVLLKPNCCPEACCLPDGTCADLTRAECLAQGGTPQGCGTKCADVECGADCPGSCGSCPDVLTCAFFNPVISRGPGAGLWRFLEVRAILEREGGPDNCFWNRTSVPINDVHKITNEDNGCRFIEADEPTYPAWQLNCYSPPSGAPSVWQIHIRVVRPDGQQRNINFAKVADLLCPEGAYFICDSPDNHQDCSSHGGTIHVPGCETDTPVAAVFG